MLRVRVRFWPLLAEIDITARGVRSMADVILGCRTNFSLVSGSLRLGNGAGYMNGASRSSRTGTKRALLRQVTDSLNEKWFAGSAALAEANDARSSLFPNLLAHSRLAESSQRRCKNTALI